MAIYGYIRVSSFDQNEERQIIALKSIQISDSNIYVDKQSGKDFKREAYKNLLMHLKSGDTLYIQSLDRLCRNYEDILKEWRYLTKKRRVDIVILDMPLLDTRGSHDLMGTFIADLVLQILSFVAENERNAIHERQAQGIAAAKARGVIFGRPSKELPDNIDELLKALSENKITLQEVLVKCNMSKATYFRKIKEFKKKTE